MRVNARDCRRRTSGSFDPILIDLAHLCQPWVFEARVNCIGLHLASLRVAYYSNVYRARISPTTP